MAYQYATREAVDHAALADTDSEGGRSEAGRRRQGRQVGNTPRARLLRLSPSLALLPSPPLRSCNSSPYSRSKVTRKALVDELVVDREPEELALLALARSSGAEGALDLFYAAAHTAVTAADTRRSAVTSRRRTVGIGLHRVRIVGLALAARWWGARMFAVGRRRWMAPVRRRAVERRR